MRVVDELVIEPGEATGGGAIGKIYGSSDDLIFEGTDGAGDYSEIFRFDYSAGRAVFEQDLYANGAAFNGSSNQFPVLAVSGRRGERSCYPEPNYCDRPRKQHYGRMGTIRVSVVWIPINGTLL